MHNIPFMKILESRYEVFHDRSCISFSVKSLTLNLFEQFTAFKIGQEQVNILCGLIRLIKLYHVVVVDRAKHINFSQN